MAVTDLRMFTGRKFSGHTTLREVECYTNAADQERMARAGMAAIINGSEVG